MIINSSFALSFVKTEKTGRSLPDHLKR